MEYERGAIINGEIFSGSEWILRDPNRWWKPRQFGTRRKAEITTCITGHWTAGEAGGARNEDRHGPRVYDVLKTRRNRKTGKKLNASIQFVIGAPKDPDDPGIAKVWQFMDPGLVAGVHVGKGYFNAKSIGVEVVSCGVPGRLNARNRDMFVNKNMLRKDRQNVRFYPAQIRAWLKLADMLTGKCIPGIEIPRQVPGDAEGNILRNRRFTNREAKRWEGAHEHYLTPGTSKIDAGGMLLEALAHDGWEVVQP